MKRTFSAVAAAAALLLCSAAQAGPFILAGTDADDHGFVSGGVNQDGWFFMQRALENLAPGVTNGNKVVTILGSTSTAATAITSAFNLSNLGAAGWSLQTVSTGSFATFFGAGGGLASSGILMMDSGFNVSGGVSGANFVPYATAIDSFLGAGGGLFSQSNGYQWLTALLPLVTTPDEFETGIALTAAGLAAFPGLTSADLSAGPYHERFEGYGAIPVLGVSTVTQNAIIIGGAAGSITNPCSVPGTPGCGNVPEPGSLALISLALGIAGLTVRRRQRI